VRAAAPPESWLHYYFHAVHPVIEFSQSGPPRLSTCPHQNMIVQMNNGASMASFITIPLLHARPGRGGSPHPSIRDFPWHQCAPGLHRKVSHSHRQRQARQHWGHGVAPHLNSSDKTTNIVGGSGGPQSKARNFIG